MRDAVFRRKANQKRARRRLQRASRRTDQTSEHEIGTLRRAGKQRTAGLRRGNRDEQDRILIHQQNGDDRHQQDQHAAGDHTFRPQAIVELAAEPRAESPGDRQQDTEAADLNGVPAESARGIDAAEREQGHQAIGVDHVGEQKRRHRLLFRQFAQRLLQFDQSRAQRFAHRALRGIIRRQQKHRQHEDDEPDTGQWTRDAIALMRDRIKTEQRDESEQRAPGVRVRGEKTQHQNEAEDAADITGGPTGAGQPPDLVRRHQRRHHRIVEDGSEFGADGRNPVGEQQRRNHGCVAGLSEPHQAGADHQQRAERRDPRLAAAARVRDRAQHRRHQRDQQPRRRGGKPP